MTANIVENDTSTARFDVRRVEGLRVVDECESLLAEVVSLVEAGREREAVQRLVDETDTWMHEGKLNVCRSLLQRAEPNRLAITASIGVLAALDPVRNETRDARDRFTREFRSYLEHVAPTRVSELMQGIR